MPTREPIILQGGGNFFPLSQPQQPSGTEITNAAVQQEMDNRKQQAALEQAAREREQARQQAMVQVQQGLMGNTNQDPVLTQMQRTLAGQILDAKKAYDLGYAIGGDMGQRQMEAASKAADNARTVLAAIGGNADYGSGLDSNQLAVALQMNDARAANNVLNGDYAMTSGAKYRQVYNELRNNGASEEYARREAENQASQYQDNRLRNLNTAFTLYGQSDNLINPTGLQFLNEMAREGVDPTGYFSSYGRPVNEYTLGNQLALAADAQQKRLEAMGANFAYGQKAADAAFSRSQTAADNALLRNKDMAEFTANLQQRIAKMNRDEAFSFAYNAYMAAGLPPQEALLASLGIANGGGKGGSGKSGVANRNDYNKDKANVLNTRLGNIEKAYGPDRSTWPEDILNEYLAIQKELGKMNIPQQEFNPADYNQAKKYMDKAFDDFANGNSDRYTLAEIIEMCKRAGIPPEWVDDYFANVRNYGQETKPSETSANLTAVPSNTSTRANLTDAQQTLAKIAETNITQARVDEAANQEKIRRLQGEAGRALTNNYRG